jgi:hypothetical protein
MSSQKVVLGPVLIKEDFLEFKRSLLKEERKKTQKKILESEKKEDEEKPPEEALGSETSGNKEDLNNSKETDSVNNNQSKESENKGTLKLTSRMIKDYLIETEEKTKEELDGKDDNFFNENSDSFFNEYGNGSKQEINRMIVFLRREGFLKED